MIREEHEKYCSQCEFVQPDHGQGLSCGHTGRPPDFEGQCRLFRQAERSDFSTDVVTSVPLETYERAGQGRRLANYLLDMVFMYLLSMILGVMIGMVLIVVDPELINGMENMGKPTEYLLGFFIVIIYYTVQEASTGRTFAKYITGTRVLSRNGQKPKFSSILLRSLCRCIPFEALTFLFSANSGLHDVLSRTIVVRVPKS